MKKVLKKGSEPCGVWYSVFGIVVSDGSKNCGTFSSTGWQFEKNSREPLYHWNGVVSPKIPVFSHTAVRNANVAIYWTFGLQKSFGFLDKLNGYIIL
jgi:hypothetical protein